MSQSNLQRLSRNDYGVAIICPLEVEMSAMRSLLDEEHIQLPGAEGDPNGYIYGRMNRQNVVIGFLPEGDKGIGAAANVATHMKRTFPKATLRILAGIGGGAPSAENDIRLGDVVIGMPLGMNGGMVQYDLGKETNTGFLRIGRMVSPPLIWRNAVVKMKSNHRDKVDLASIFEKNLKVATYQRPSADQDILFLPRCHHALGEPNCQKCDLSEVVIRTARQSSTPIIHYGLIASGDRVIKNADVRDKLAKDAGGALCFEMEAAGLGEDFECIIVRGICDYSDSHKNDEWHEYAALVAAECAKELLSHVAPAITYSTNLNVYWNINRIANPLFTGRGEVIAKITDAVYKASQDDDPTMEQCRIVLTGMGGQGKSEVCLKVAAKVRSSFWGVFWVDVSSTVSAENSFLAIGKQMNISANSVDEVRQSLTNARHSWILILDNADDNGVDYQQYFPASSTGIVILTSRNKECHLYASEGNAISLDKLDQQEACDLLLKAARVSGTAKKAFEKAATYVASSLLHGHPLAVIQAGTYIFKTGCSISDYPAIFQKHRKRALTYRSGQALSRYHDVYATFEASARIIQSSSDESANDALQLLSILGVMASSTVPLSLFEAAWGGARDVIQSTVEWGEDQQSDSFRLTDWHVSQLLPLLEVDKDVWDDFRLIEAVRYLELHSFVTVTFVEGLKLVSMHPLTHSWAQDRQESALLRQSWLTALCTIAMSSWQWQYWSGTQLQLGPHLQHVVSARKTVQLNLWPQERVTATLYRCGCLLEYISIRRELKDLIEDLFCLLEIDPDTPDQDYRALYMLRARIWSHLGQHTSRIALLEQIVNVDAQKLPENSKIRLTALHDLGVAHEYNGEIERAISILERVVEIKSGTLAEDHLDRLASQHALALAYRDNGQVDQAIAILERVIIIKEQTLPMNHPSRLRSQHVLAMAYADKGLIEQAIALLEQVVKIKGQTLAEDHPERITSQHTLAGLYRDNGQINQATALQEVVVRVERQSLAKDHPDRLISQQNLALYYSDQGRKDEALRLIRQVVEVQRQNPDMRYEGREGSEELLRDLECQQDKSDDSGYSDTQ